MSQPIEPEVEPVLEPTEGDLPIDPPGPDSEPDPQPVEVGVETPFAGLGIPELENATLEQAAHMYQTAKQGMMATRRELDSVQNAPAPPVDITQDEFYSNPAESYRTIVQEALNETVAPILIEIDEGKRDRLFDRFRIKYGEDFTSLEPYILGMFEGTGTPVNEGSLMAYYTSARGMRGMGIPGGPVDAPVTTAAPVVNNRQPIPPHQSPSSPPPPPKPGDTPRQLTEEERDLCRLRGITHDEYRAEVAEFGEEGPYVVDSGGEAQNG